MGVVLAQIVDHLEEVLVGSMSTGEELEEIRCKVGIFGKQMD